MCSKNLPSGLISLIEQLSVHSYYIVQFRLYELYIVRSIINKTIFHREEGGFIQRRQNSLFNIEARQTKPRLCNSSSENKKHLMIL